MNPTLNQISFLAQTLQRNENLQKHFDLETAFDKLMDITIGQLKYFHLLLQTKKYSKLNSLLTGRGFKQKYEQS
jgi:hypothetical protein